MTDSLRIRFLRDHRHQPVRPHKVAADFAAWLDRFAYLARTLAIETSDDGWHRLANELALCCEALRHIA